MCTIRARPGGPRTAPSGEAQDQTIGICREDSVLAAPDHPAFATGSTSISAPLENDPNQVCPPNARHQRRRESAARCMPLLKLLKNPVWGQFLPSGKSLLKKALSDLLHKSLAGTSVFLDHARYIEASIHLSANGTSPYSALMPPGVPTAPASQSSRSSLYCAQHSTTPTGYLP